jgi:hypothetical protein
MPGSRVELRQMRRVSVDGASRAELQAVLSPEVKRAQGAKSPGSQSVAGQFLKAVLSRRCIVRVPSRTARLVTD